MSNYSLANRLGAILTATIFLIASFSILPGEVLAAKSEGRTRISVHKSRDFTRDRKRKDININKNINVNIKDKRRHYGDRYKPYYYDRRRHHHHNDVGKALVVGAIAGLAIGTIITAASMPPSCTSLYVNGYPYRQCGNTWYQPHYVGSQVNYVVVEAPH